ncbi:MAG: hypothetical protein CM15mP18_0450 [Methanobacteriota archaeon]|nr:MAG: hypothetical protein CM15mP18_0450 [Euryarchaeota archaeon]
MGGGQDARAQVDRYVQRTERLLLGDEFLGGRWARPCRHASRCVHRRFAHRVPQQSPNPKRVGSWGTRFSEANVVKEGPAGDGRRSRWGVWGFSGFSAPVAQPREGCGYSKFSSSGDRRSPKGELGRGARGSGAEGARDGREPKKVAWPQVRRERRIQPPRGSDVPMPRTNPNRKKILESPWSGAPEAVHGAGHRSVEGGLAAGRGLPPGRWTSFRRRDQGEAPEGIEGPRMTERSTPFGIPKKGFGENGRNPD